MMMPKKRVALVGLAVLGPQVAFAAESSDAEKKKVDVFSLPASDVVRGVSFLPEAPEVYGNKPGNYRNKATITHAFFGLLGLRARLSLFAPPEGLLLENGDISMQTTTLTQSSDEHIDHLCDSGGAPVPEGQQVGFIALNTNEKAHFDIEEMCVPIVEGSFVAFDGSLRHQTIVRGGHVSLAGPFHLASMENVGGACPDENVQSPEDPGWTFDTVGQTNQTCIKGGAYIEVDVVVNGTYSVDTCVKDSYYFDTKLAVYDNSSLLLGNNDDHHTGPFSPPDCGSVDSAVIFTATATPVKVLLNEYGGCSSTSDCEELRMIYYGVGSCPSCQSEEICDLNTLQCVPFGPPVDVGCPGNTTLALEWTFDTAGQTNQTCIKGGEYIEVDVVVNGTYSVDTCFSDYYYFDTELVIYDNNGLLIGLNDDHDANDLSSFSPQGCHVFGSAVIFTATTTPVKVLLNGLDGCTTSFCEDVRMIYLTDADNDGFFLEIEPFDCDDSNPNIPFVCPAFECSDDPIDDGCNDTCSYPTCGLFFDCIANSCVQQEGSFVGCPFVDFNTPQAYPFVTFETNLDGTKMFFDCIKSGEILFVVVIPGKLYSIDTCGGGNIFDTQVTVIDYNTLAVIAANDDFGSYNSTASPPAECDTRESFLTFTAPAEGNNDGVSEVIVIISEKSENDCLNSNKCTNLRITQLCTTGTDEDNDGFCSDTNDCNDTDSTLPNCPLLECSDSPISDGCPQAGTCAYPVCQFATCVAGVCEPNCDTLGPGAACTTAAGTGTCTAGGQCVSTRTASAGGDPHYTTFQGLFFSYHGEGEFVLFKSEGFASGAGLIVTIRTTFQVTRHAKFSSITSVALKLGHDVFEVQAEGAASYLNGKATMVKNRRHALLGGGLYKIKKSFRGVHKKIVMYLINLGDGRSITIRLRFGIITVELTGNFEDASYTGMLGTSGHPGLRGRNGEEYSEDWIIFGESFQVRGAEEELFREARAPRYPEKPLYELSAASKEVAVARRRHGRRLNEVEEPEQVVSVKSAMAACAGSPEGHKKMWCIDDCLAFNSLDISEDPFYH